MEYKIQNKTQKQRGVKPSHDKRNPNSLDYSFFVR